MSMVEDCTDALRIGFDLVRAGDATAAAKVFDDVLRATASVDGPEARELEVVARYGAGQASAAVKPQDEAQRRADVSALAHKLGAPSATLDCVDLAAEVLMSMGENLLAIPYCNKAVALTGRNSSAIAGRLWRAGRCYIRAGFPQEAQPPLRSAVERLRKPKGEALLPHALLDLGSACLQSDPVLAEPCYREAADLWVAEGKVNQAATAWLNLGVVCSRAERLDEALAWYEKVREAREADPRATRAQRSNIHNNIASIYRKKRDFRRARAEVERAIEIAAPEGGATLANAYGSFGEICRDEKSHEEALVWFRRAREEFERQANPRLDQLVTKLENEAVALERVGRAGEAVSARERIARLNGLSAPPAPNVPNVVQAKGDVGEDEGETTASVIVVLDGVGLPDEIYAKFDLGTLENRLERRLEDSGDGEFDGNEFGPETTLLFFYGRDAQKIFDVIAPVLRDYPLCRGARIKLQQGEAISEFSLDSLDEAPRS